MVEVLALVSFTRPFVCFPVLRSGYKILVVGESGRHIIRLWVLNLRWLFEVVAEL